MLSLLLYLVIVLVITSLVLWAVDSAPFVTNPRLKQMVHWLVVVIAVVICIAVLLQFLGVHVPPALR